MSVGSISGTGTAGDFQVRLSKAPQWPHSPPQLWLTAPQESQVHTGSSGALTALASQSFAASSSWRSFRSSSAIRR